MVAALCYRDASIGMLLQLKKLLFLREYKFINLQNPQNLVDR